MNLSQSQKTESRYLQLMAMQDRAAMSMASFEQDANEYDNVIIRARMLQEANARNKRKHFLQKH